MKEVFIQLGGYGSLVFVLGYFLKKFVEKQDTLTDSVNKLTNTLIRIEGELRLYESQRISMKADIEELRDDVESVDMRLTSLERVHIEKTSKQACG